LIHDSVVIAMFLPAGFSTTTESQLSDILGVVAAALQRVRESHEKNANRDIERAHIIARRKKINLDRTAHSYDPAPPQDAMNALGPGNDEGISGSDEKGAQLPPPLISPVGAPVPIASRRGVEEAVDDLPIVLITNYQPQGAKREELLNVLAEWAAKLVEDKVSVLCPRI
jgi:hypothetical protein